MKSVFPIALALLTVATAVTRAAELPPADMSAAIAPAELQAFKANLLSTLTRHLNLLLGADGSVNSLKGKTADGQEAMAFYLMFELTGEQKYRRAALALADQILREMRRTKFGVLPIKEKDKPDGGKITGRGPPALGNDTSRVAYILHREGGRPDDLKYLAHVLDQYPWNERGWWAATIDVKTGESKLPLSKPSPINKTAAIQQARIFALKYIAPMTDSNSGPGNRPHATRDTPERYLLKDDLKRAFQLGLILNDGRPTHEGIKVIQAALSHFPFGDKGQDGAHAAEPVAFMLSGL